MANLQSILYTLCSLLFLLATVEALKFDVEAYSRGDKKGERCIRNFVARDTLVVVTATVDGERGDGMVVNMHVSWQMVEEDLWRASANALGVDQRRSWKRIWATEGCCRGAKNGFHISRRRII